MSERKIAVIGDEDSVFIFKALGAEIFSPPPEKLKEVFEKIIKEGFGMCFITEEYASLIMEAIREAERRLCPLIFIFPQPYKEKGLNRLIHKEIFRKALGKEEFFDERG